jgi:hypothetical protein
MGKNILHYKYLKIKNYSITNSYRPITIISHKLKISYQIRLKSLNKNNYFLG